MRFPSWTPKWVEEEFHIDFSDHARESPHWSEGDDQSREWLVQIINSPSSSIVWDALEKYPEKDDRLSDLAASVWSALWGFGHVATKRSERAKIAKDARRHAVAFASCLKQLTHQDWFAMNSIVHSFADVSISRRITEEIEAFHAIFNDDPESASYVPIDTLLRARPAIEQIAKNIASDALWGDLEYHLLGGLCGSIDKWAESDTIVTKPDHPNAKRLYFIRSMTRSFVEAYGRPMRKETLALASVFFDCDGLDEAAISRLAPVRMASNIDELIQPE